MNANLTFGGWLKRRRQGLGLTQKELARRIGYAAVSVRKAEADERRPSREMAEKLAIHLDIPPEDRNRFVAFARDESGWEDFKLTPQTALVDHLGGPVARGTAGATGLPFARPRFLNADSASTEHVNSEPVARSQVVAHLRELLEASLAGQGQIAFLTGEAGSGKSTLLNAFARDAQHRVSDLLVAVGTCQLFTGVGDPYLPFREVMSTLSGDLEAAWISGAVTRENATHMWQQLPQVVDAIVSRGPDLLNTFVSAPTLLARAEAHSPGRTAWRERLQLTVEHAMGRGPDQSRLFEEYTEVLLTLAQRQPMLLLLDDLQWADVSSIALLFHLARSISDQRIFLLGAFRPEAIVWPTESRSLESVISEIQRQHGNVKIRLDEEVVEERRRFVDDLLDLEPNQLDEEFRQALLDHGRGHPLFTVELLRDLQEQGDLFRNGEGHWVIGQDLTWDSVPVRVEGVIEQRVGRLDADLREVLAVASVMGESFTAEVVASVLDREPRQVIQWLSKDLQKRHRLVRAEDVRNVGGQRLSFYRFRHSLFQLYLYQSLDDVERVYLHEAVGNALRDVYRDEQDLIPMAGTLARHYEEAQRAAKASNYHLLAGRYAAQMSAHQEAIAHLQQGLAQLEFVSDSPERRRQELELRLTLAVSITTTRGYANPAAHAEYMVAGALAETDGDIFERFRAKYGLWRSAIMGAELEKARDLGYRLMRLAQESGDEGLLLEAYRAEGVNLYHAGKFVPALSALEAGLSLYDFERHRNHAFEYGHDPAISFLAYLAHTLFVLGDAERANERISELVRLAWRLAHPFSLGYSMSFGAATACQYQRDVDGTLRWSEQALAFATRRGFPFWQAIGTILNGWARAMDGAGSESVRVIRTGLSIWRDTGSTGFIPYYDCLLAEACALTGDIDAGLVAVNQGLASAHATGERHYESELHRMRGELMLLRGSGEAAAAAFELALDVARTQGAKAFEERALASLDRL